MMEPAIGSWDWLEATGGRLRFADRLALVAAAPGAIAEGFRLARRARRSGRRDLALAPLAPPSTPIVSAARAHLAACASREMANHSLRTGYWTAAVLAQQDALTPEHLETAWVAALLHDVGLEAVPARGDFTAAGVEALERLAREHGWPPERTRAAADAIVANLSTRVNRGRLGLVAWAMNVGGMGELGFGPHRAQLDPGRVAELETLFPRDGFRAVAMRAIAAEARRLPDGRFAFLGRFFPLIMR